MKIHLNMEYVLIYINQSIDEYNPIKKKIFFEGKSLLFSS